MQKGTGPNCTEALAFAFNMSLASVNMARAIAAMNGLNLSVESIKLNSISKCNNWDVDDKIIDNFIVMN